MSSVEFLQQVCQSHGVARAYELALKAVQEHTTEMNNLWNSRFFERTTLEDGTKKIWPVLEKTISSAYDMADCHDGEPREFLYCDTDGQLYPVTVGGTEPIASDSDEPPFHYASGNMIANGKVVGTVIYTDH